MSELKNIPCPECGTDDRPGVPVWEDLSEWSEGKAPDYIGCRACNTMTDYSEWWPPNDTVNDETLLEEIRSHISRKYRDYVKMGEVDND